MRFVGSLALLSLAGLGLAAPGNSNAANAADLAKSSGSSDPLGLTGLLGLRDEDKLGSKNHQANSHGRGVRRRQADYAADAPGVPGDDSTFSTTTLLRARHGGEHGGDDQQSEGDGDGKGKSKGEGQSKSKGKPKSHEGQNSSNGKTKSKGKSSGGGGGGGGSGSGKGKCNDARHTPCLHPNDVDTLVAAYTRMLSHWNETDAKYLADNFSDTSDSINILAGIPLGDPTFPTKEAFIEHQRTQPDNLPLVITHTSPYSCDEIALIWQATFGVAQQQVRGLTVLGATKDKGFWQIKTVDVEFNSIAYLLNIGGSVAMPGAQ